MLRLFDTLTQEKQPFEPREPGRVSIYVCGPTVYDYSHLGHARVYVVFDTVVRYLRHRGFAVTYVRNFTDVDDKVIARAVERGRDPVALAAEFAQAFSEDMDRLGCARPDVQPRVSEHVPDIVSLVQALEDKGVAYPAGDTVWFAVRRHPGYGKLSKRNLDDLRSGARVEVDADKQDPLDFALWKGAKRGEPSWDSPWGAGRPGWHIECSAMSTRYLGERFDIHGGGMDLVFPHHENEIAQAEAAHGPGYARYWMHNGFVNLNQEKMAKSTGNFFTLRDLFQHAEPEAIRLFLLSVQYRHPINFKVESRPQASGGDAAAAADDDNDNGADAAPRFPDLEEAERRLSYFYETRLRLAETRSPMKDPGDGEVVPELELSLAAFTEAMDDDFNTAAALAPVSELFRLANRLLEDPKAAPKAVRKRTLFRLQGELDRLGEVLGLWQQDPAQYLERTRAAEAARRGIDPAWVEARLAERAEARREKDFARSDALRDELARQGIELQDTPSGTRWRLTDPA